MRRGLVFAFLLACSNPPPPQPWPAGSYCVLRDGGGCPQATNGTFEKGSIVIDTDEGLAIDDGGATHEIDENEHDGLLSLEVCCGTFDDVGVSFPAEPFVVLAGGTPDAVRCPAGFTPGSIFIDAEDSELFGDEADSYVEGNVGASSIVLNRNVDILVCESGGPLDGVEMPLASYCVISAGGTCPEGFSGGSITSYDETTGNKNELTGSVGGVTQRGAATNFPVCCN